MPTNVFFTKIYDVIMATNQEKAPCLFIVMEHVESDLKKVLNKSGSIDFTEDHVLTILYNALCALNFMHTANLMHRDIKPANILVDNDCQIKLCDFGLSRSVPQDLIIPDFKSIDS